MNFEPEIETHHFMVDDDYVKPNELPKKNIIRLEKLKRVVFYNSLAVERIQVVTLRISKFNVQVSFSLESTEASVVLILNVLGNQ